MSPYIQRYTDITHEVKPIETGYRLVLSYNLIHTTTRLRPALSCNITVAQRMEHVLRSWKEDKFGTAPARLICLLDHQYSEANSSAGAMKGADARRSLPGADSHTLGI
jgi:hypothetical protein